MSEPIPTPEDPNPPEWPTDPTLPDEGGTPPDVVEPEPTPEPEAQPGWATYADEAAAEAITQATEIAGRLAPRNMDRAPTAEDGAGLPAGTGWNEYDPATDDLVQMWRWDGAVWARLDMSPELIPVIDIGSGTVGDLHGDRIVAHTISADSINGGAFTGETFTGGTFTGGEFRTSDALPGQVTLSDTACSDPVGGGYGPGVRVEPRGDSSAYSILPSVGPNINGMLVSGGRDISGSAAYTIYTPTSTQSRWQKGGASSTISAAEERSYLRAVGEGGEYGIIDARPGGANVAYVDADNVYFSRIRADANEAFLYTRAGGTNRYLSVDKDGVWVKTNKSGSYMWYNLEETAQDSGWQSFPVRSGIAASDDLAWRNKGGIIWFRGHVYSSAWALGAWTTVVTGLDSSLWPSASRVAPAPHASVPNLRLQITSDGALQVWVPTAANGGSASATIEMDALHYPTG